MGGMRSGWAVAAAGAQQVRINRLENDVFMLSKKIEELGGKVSDARTREFRDKVKRSMCDAKVSKLRDSIRAFANEVRELERNANEDEAAAEAAARGRVGAGQEEAGHAQRAAEGAAAVAAQVEHEALAALPAR